MTTRLRIYILKKEGIKNFCPFSMDDYQTLCLVFLLVSGSLGVVLNIGFLVLSFRRVELNKCYTFFLSSVSFMNFIYSANNAILQPVAVAVNVSQKSAYCTLVAFTTSFSGLAAVFLRTFVALNRYVSLCYPTKQKTMFSRRNNWIMSVITVFISVFITFIFYFLDDLARLGNTVCGPDIETMPFIHTLVFMVPISVVYGICIYSGYNIWRILKRHQANAERLGSRLQHAREILLLLLIELLVPILLETPLIISTVLRHCMTVPKMALSAFVCLFISYPVVEPVIVVLILKPYKLAVMKQWRSWRGDVSIERVATTFSNAETL